MGRVRLIAGTLGGRRLRFPDEPGLRPTPERAREALFSILGDAIRGATVLDLYAGSGALGIEALSRGAARAWFVDVNPRCARAIRAAAAELGIAGRCGVVVGDALALPPRGRVPEVVDLILADPPYEGTDHGRVLAAAAARLADGGHLVLERRGAGPAESPPSGLRLARSARYGDTRFDIYRPVRGAAPTAGGPPDPPG